MATPEQTNEPRMAELEDLEVRYQRLAEILSAQRSMAS